MSCRNPHCINSLSERDQEGLKLATNPFPKEEGLFEKKESSFLLSSPAVVTMPYRSYLLLSRKRTFRIGTEKAEGALAPTVVSRGLHMGIKEFIYEIRNRWSSKCREIDSL